MNYETIDKIGDYPFDVIGFNQEWIDEDFNPNGTRICHQNELSESGWTSLAWNNDQDGWFDRDEPAPTHFMYVPKTESLIL